MLRIRVKLARLTLGRLINFINITYRFINLLVIIRVNDC